MDKKNYYLFCFCGAFLVLKLLSINMTNFDLYGDEAQYWLWSKNLALGYYSKPPLLSWLIFIVTSFFGNSFFVLKAIPVVLYCFTAILVFIFTKKLLKKNSLAICCSLSFFLLPAVSLSSFLLSTDVVLILFWTMTLIFLLKIKEDSNYFNFAAFGFFLGLTFLAKYAAIYFLLGLFLLCVIDSKYRKFFYNSKLKLLLAFFVLILVLLPNMFWNYQNSWLTLGHTADNASLDKISLNFLGFLELLITQAIMVGPLLFVFFIFYFFKKFKITPEEKLLISFSLPALIIVLVEGFLVRAHANWAAVSFVSLLIFFVSVVYRLNRNIVYINNYINLLVGVVLFFLIAINSNLSPFNRIAGVKDFVIFINQKNQNNINNFVVTDRLLFANLNYSYHLKGKNFYSPHDPKNIATHHFQLKHSLPKDFSQSFILIGEESDIAYLQKKRRGKLLGTGSFPFYKGNINIYEITID